MSAERQRTSKKTTNKRKRSSINRFVQLDRNDVASHRPGKSKVLQIWNFVMRNLENILLPHPVKTALLLCSIVLIGSVLHDLDVMPKSYFSGSKNVFNQWGVKWGWGWTLSLLTPYMVLAGLLTCDKQWYLVLKDCLRLAVGTFFWFAWIQLFLAIEHVTGTCNASGFPTKKSCIRAGFQWDGFDISGHTFILIHSLLTILEELQLMRQIYSNDRKIEMSCQHISWLDTVQPMLKQLLYIFTFLLVFLCYLWMWMLLCTAVYFHTFSHKILAAPIAIGTWLFNYRFWYQKPFSPGPVRSLNLKS
ncbi:fat storage-inducing transmembrane protein 2-like [Anneissia japonica]|uniref:fat storage-inducing transmembrane protein 2-like n=1 Tax=Anneissia japonica TaxID=1529436 RepID=UPI0014255156|nr:fat storage-inducing transmembrane protein 2-like [Anneissia japonica]